MTVSSRPGSLPRRHTICSWLPLVLILLCPVAGFAADGHGQPDVRPPEPASWRQEVTLLVGAGHNVRVATSKLHHPFLTQAIEGSWLVTGVHGPGRLAGSLELLVEVDPVFVMWQEGQPVYGFGLLPVFFRWNFGRTPRFQPFIDLAGGFVRTDRSVPTGTVRFNFIAESGMGLRLGLTRHTGLLLGYRFHHLSNAGRGTTNPSVNSHMFYVGVSVLR